MTATAVTHDSRTTGDGELGRVNDAEWVRGRHVAYYSHRQLRPVEIVLFTRYAEDFRGRVVELGCGAGRVTGYLAHNASEVVGIDLSPEMIAAARARYERPRFLQGDMRDLSAFRTGSVDVVFAGCNILDVFDDAERRVTLREIHRVLAPGGLFVMSSHNRAHIPHIPRPTRVRLSGPRAFAQDVTRLPIRVARHRRLAALQRDEPGYAIVNNAAHDFSLVHYFITADAQLCQLESEGFRPLGAWSHDGEMLGPRDAAAQSLELHYVARTPTA